MFAFIILLMMHGAHNSSHIDIAISIPSLFSAVLNADTCAVVSNIKMSRVHAVICVSLNNSCNSCASS